MSKEERKDGVPLEVRMRDGSGIRANIPIYPFNQQAESPLTVKEMKDLMEKVRQNRIPVREDSEKS